MFASVSFASARDAFVWASASFVSVTDSFVSARVSLVFVSTSCVEVMASYEVASESFVSASVLAKVKFRTSFCFFYGVSITGAFYSLTGLV